MRIGRKIKVLVVDDSLLFRETLVQGIKQDSGIEVVGTASDPFIARDKILELEPDVLTLDVEMPKMNGIEFLKRLMPQYPLPVVVVSAVSTNVFDAMNAGAVDFVTKPDVTRPGGLQSFINELVLKIKIASVAKVECIKKYSHTVTSVSGKSAKIKDAVIAIGASTGGTEAVCEIIKAFPKEMPGVVVVQHMPPVFTRMYAERLDKNCVMEVKEAVDGDEVKPGRVIIAQGDYHMKLVREHGNYYVRIYQGENVNGHCPSIDVLFDSVADAAGRRAIGIILTGMGTDGAKGLLNLKKRGAYTIGQDEKTSVVYGMPMVAYNIGAVDVQKPLNKIPKTIFEYLSIK